MGKYLCVAPRPRAASSAAKRLSSVALLSALALFHACSPRVPPREESAEKQPEGEIVADYMGGVITLDDVKDEMGFVHDPGVPIPIEVCTAPRSVTDTVKFIASRDRLIESARARGLDQEEDFRKLLPEKRKKLLAQTYKRRILEKVTSDEAYEYYNHRISDFMQEDYHLYRNIFIQFDKGNQEDREKAMTAAKAALDALRSGEDFAAVERRFSTRPEEGLDQEFRMYGQTEVYPPIREAIENLKPGEVSDIIEARHGFMILKLIDYKPAWVTPFEEVELFCRGRVSTIKTEMEVQQEIEKRGIRVNEERLYSSDRLPTDVVAEGRGFTLLAKDVDRLPSPRENPSERDVQRMKATLMQAVGEALVVEKAEAAGIASDPEIQRQLEGFRKRTLALLELDREIQERLEASTMTEDQMKAHFEKYRYAFVSRLETQIRVINIESGHERETQPDKIHFAWQTAEETASELVERIQAGEDFGTLAKEYSTGFNADDGGLLPYQPYGPRGRVIDMAVEPMEIGEVTGPVRYDQGLYLIKLEGKVESAPLSFEEAKEDVRKDLFWTKAEQFQNEIVDETCRRAGLVMKQDWGTQAEGVDAS